MTFYLFGEPDEALRLRSYTSSSRGTKMTIKIELEVTNPYDFAYALQRLGEVQTGQRAKPEKPNPRTKTKPLALPAPQLSLPKPPATDDFEGCS